MPIPLSLASEALQGLSFLAGGEVAPIFSPVKKRGSVSGAPVTRRREREKAIRLLYILRGTGLTRDKAISLLPLSVTKRELLDRWEPKLRKDLEGKKLSPRHLAIAEGFEWARQYWFVEGGKLSGRTLAELVAWGRRSRIGDADSLRTLWQGTAISRSSRTLYDGIVPRLKAKAAAGGSK